MNSNAPALMWEMGLGGLLFKPRAAHGRGSLLWVEIATLCRTLVCVVRKMDVTVCKC